MSRKGGPPRVDSAKQTARREKRGGAPAPAPRPGSGRGGAGQPSQPSLPQDPASGAPYTEPGLAGTGKRGKRTRGY